VAAAIFGVGGYLLLSDGNVPLIGPSVPPTTFEFESVRVAATTTGQRKDASRTKARGAGRRIEFVMNQLYTFAFADESQWGDYGDAWGLFEGTAAERAEADVEALTLGAEANGIYEKLDPQDSTLVIMVLTDDRARPVSAIAEVSFGTATTVTSEGSFFLRPGEDGWLIYAYSIDRNEQATSPSPSAEAS
jgi:hypothetical protein